MLKKLEDLKPEHNCFFFTALAKAVEIETCDDFCGEINKDIFLIKDYELINDFIYIFNDVSSFDGNGIYISNYGEKHDSEIGKDIINAFENHDNFDYKVNKLIKKYLIPNVNDRFLKEVNSLIKLSKIKRKARVSQTQIVDVYYRHYDYLFDLAKALDSSIPNVLAKIIDDYLNKDTKPALNCLTTQEEKIVQAFEDRIAKRLENIELSLGLIEDKEGMF